MTRLFSTVLDMSLTASLVIGVVLVLRLLLRRAPKVYSYALWSVVLFRLLCPVSIKSGVSILPAQVGHTATEVPAVLTGPVEREEYTPGAPNVIAVPVSPSGEVEVPNDLPESGVWLAIFSRLWPTGTVLMAGYSLCSLWRLRRRLRTATRLRDNIWQAEGLETAFVLGVFRPKIYLPAGLTEGEMPYIIRHEEYHIRRGDHIIKILAFAALCIHWFNPLVWVAFVLAGKDMEMSCDEAVLKQMGGGIRADYSQSLLALATGRGRIAATPLAFGEGDPKSRIKNVLNWKKPKVWVSVLALVVCVAGICACAADPVEVPEEPAVSAPVEEPTSPDRETAPTPQEPEEEIQDPSEPLTREQALHEAIMRHHRSSQSSQYFCCANYIVLANVEGSRMNLATGGIWPPWIISSGYYTRSLIFPAASSRSWARHTSPPTSP